MDWRRGRAARRPERRSPSSQSSPVRQKGCATRFRRVGLPGNGVHRRGDSPAFAERRPDGTKRNGHSSGENADQLDRVVHGIAHFLLGVVGILAVPRQCRADVDHCKHGEDVGLDGSGQQIERHEGDRHEKTGQRQHDRANEDSAHDVAEQPDDQRERARELLGDVERDHDPGRLGKGGEVAEIAQRADAVKDRRAKDDRSRTRRPSPDVRSAPRYPGSETTNWR